MTNKNNFVYMKILILLLVLTVSVNPAKSGVAVQSGAVGEPVQIGNDELANIGELVGITDKEITAKGVELQALKNGDTQLTFTNYGSEINIGGDKFNNIKTQNEAGLPSSIEFDKKGDIQSAAFTVNENGGNYCFGNTCINAPPNSRVFFDKQNGIGILAPDGAEFQDAPKAKDPSLPHDYLTTIQSQHYGQFVLPGGFSVNGELNFQNGQAFISPKKIVRINGVEISNGDILKELNVFFDGRKDEGVSFDFNGRKLIVSSESNDNININFKSDNPYVLFSNKQNLNVKMFKQSEIEIENRDSLKTAPKLKITGDINSQKWVDLTDGEANIEIGAGKFDYKLPRRGNAFSGVPLELSMIDSEGKNLVSNSNGGLFKVSISQSGLVSVGTENSILDERGLQSCYASGIEIKDCEIFSGINGFDSNEAAINSARDEYLSNIDRKHDFQPEYKQNLNKISLYMPNNAFANEITDTQVDIMKQLPEYTQINLLVDSNSAKIKDYLRQTLPPDIFSRVNFINAPSGAVTSVWAQDFSEGDSQVQIVPLTYLGGGGSFDPNNPRNEFIYGFQSQGIDVRKVPVGFGGGNVFIANNKDGDKVLLIGSNEYIYTQDVYKKISEQITEEQFKDILKNSFNVNRVEIIGTRNLAGNLENQPGKMFHIDQSMMPIEDGVVAMPIISNLQKPDFSDEDIRKRAMDSYKKLAERYGFEYNPKNEYDKPYPRTENTLSKEQLDILYNEGDTIYKEFITKRYELSFYQDALDAQKKLNSYREQMNSLGFEIVDLKVSPSNIGGFQAYTNGIVYRDKTTGEKTVIMPIFPNEKGEYLMNGLNFENKQSFEKAGYRVKTVKDKAFKSQGNLHCLTLLAQNEKDPENCQLCEV